MSILYHCSSFDFGLGYYDFCVPRNYEILTPAVPLLQEEHRVAFGSS